MIAGGVASLEYHANKKKKKSFPPVALRTRRRRSGRVRTRGVVTERFVVGAAAISFILSRLGSLSVGLFSFFLFFFLHFYTTPDETTTLRLRSSTVKEARSDESERDVTRKIEESSRRALKHFARPSYLYHLGQIYSAVRRCGVYIVE